MCRRSDLHLRSLLKLYRWILPSTLSEKSEVAFMFDHGQLRKQTTNAYALHRKHASLPLSIHVHVIILCCASVAELDAD